jgi:hypothetical protein
MVEEKFESYERSIVKVISVITIENKSDHDQYFIINRFLQRLKAKREKKKRKFECNLEVFT